MVVSRDVQEGNLWERNGSSMGITLQMMPTSDESNARDHWMQMVSLQEGLQPSM